ncbi:nucleoside deaminase [Iodidimonas gelatinilytica]|nr:nucleoside deaminase [Iodidimonas gelatinilytica]
MTENPLSPMEIAFLEAEQAAAGGEVPVGAVITDSSGAVISRAGNRVLTLKDPTAHAEMLAIRDAARILGSERLTGCDLYVTLEPCAMCAQAISFARIRRLYYGAEDEKGGGVRYGARVFSHATCHHKPDIYAGFSEQRAALLLKDFFQSRR